MKAEDIAKMDADEIMAKQVEELEKEKKELQVRLKAKKKKVDHLERAKRLEEIPLLKLQFEELKEEAKVVWEEQEKDRIEEEKQQRASDVENRDRMVRMRDDKDKYLESLLKERKNVFEKKITEFNVLVDEERKIRLERRKNKEEEMNWHLKSVKRGKLGKHLRNKEKRRSMRRKRQSLRKLKGKRGRKSVKLRKSLRGRKKKGVNNREMIDWVEIEEVLGELVGEGRRMTGLGVEHGEVVVEVVDGGIERRGRKTSGDRGVEIEEKEEMMMVHLEDVARHLQEEVLHQEEDLHQEVTAELGEGGMLPQEDLHQGAGEVGMTVLREGAPPRRDFGDR